MCFFLHMWISALTAYSMRFSMKFHADMRLSMYINKNVYALMEQNAWPILTYCPTKIWIIFRIWKRWTRYVFSQKTRAPAKNAEPSMWNPEKGVRDVILCTSDPIHINFLQSWMAIGQETPPFRICINLTSNFFGAAPLAEKVEFLWRAPPLVIRGDQFSNWSVASPSSLSFH